MDKRVCRWLSPVIVALLSLTGCQKEGHRGSPVTMSRNALQEQANEVIGSIQYMKDCRTNLCFAYRWGAHSNGGPSLATVPCEAIPPRLLTVSR